MYIVFENEILFMIIVYYVNFIDFDVFVFSEDGVYEYICINCM